MRKWILTFFIICITGNVLQAQSGLNVKGTENNLYLDHTVDSKETLYSIGRLFNVAPRDIASYNHLAPDAGLNVGQAIKIPLVQSNFTQNESVAVNEVLVPVYHTVLSGETLYRLGVNYNKVPLDLLKKWNRLSSDAVTVGTPMIVGFLKVDKNQSALAAQQSSPGIIPAPSPVEIVASAQNKAQIIITPEPAKPEAENNQPVTTQYEPSETKVTTVNTRSNINFNGGFFKNIFEQQNSGQSPDRNAAIAGVFKSTSGWQDGKYYCFIDGAAPGTIIQITDIVSGKSVYAKVLDAIPEIKQNEGFNILISNAAAEELGAIENKFNCTLSYVRS